MAYIIVTGYVLACVFGFIITCFFLFHLWMIKNQYTTIEFCEKRKSDQNFKNMSPYNLGCVNNFKSILGANPLFWIIPVKNQSQGDGLFFQVRPGLLEEQKERENRANSQE
jgi:hypothetical protein